MTCLTIFLVYYTKWPGNDGWVFGNVCRPGRPMTI